MWDEDDAVGYGRPPRWTQFEKGRSGNPKGRPKKKPAEPTPAPLAVSAVDNILRRELGRKIKVTDGGKTREMDMLELSLRSQLSSAAKGNAFAQRETFRQAQELERRDMERQEAQRQSEQEMLDHMVTLKALQAKKWASCESTGIEPDGPWPHPDDILIDQVKGTWNIRGPFDETDLGIFEHYRAERDTLFARSTLYDRKQPPESKAKPSIWMLLWITWDAKLPKRWQIIDDDGAWWSHWMLPIDQLEAKVEACALCAEELRIAANTPLRDKESYRVTNKVMKPLLKRHGYLSMPYPLYS